MDELTNEISPHITTAELDQLCLELIEEIQSDIVEYDERAALQREHIDTSVAATTQRAIQALGRPERFIGEHDVARAWLISLEREPA